MNYKIGEAAERLEVSVATLRFYEQKGLARPLRSAGGTRYYNEEGLDRLRVILDLAHLELPLDALAELAGIRAEHTSGDSASRAVENHLAALEVELVEKQKRLRAMLADLRLARQRLTGCHNCPKRPTRENCAGCAVADDLLATRVMCLVWDEAAA
jgi:DNA-binding transcriptional MerR regulator